VTVFNFLRLPPTGDTTKCQNPKKTAKICFFLPLEVNLSVFPNPHALVVVNKGMRPVKRFSNKIIQFLNAGVG